MITDRIAAGFQGFYETFFPGNSHFTQKDIPDLTGKVAVVTGGNAGIGYEVIKGLLDHGAKVYMAARNPERLDESIKLLEKETGKRAIPLIIDLNSLVSVRAAANEFLGKEPALHMLFNNAGTGEVDELTDEGYDVVFCGNVLGHFFLAQLLIPALLNGVSSAPDGKARVVTTSSVLHVLGWLNFESFRDSPAWRRMFGEFRYCQSKFGGIVISNEFAKRHGDQGIVFTSFNPGSIRTKIYDTMYWFEKWPLYPTQYDASHGAITALWAGTSSETVDMNGYYLVPWAKVGRALEETRDPALGKKLWDWCEAQVQDK